MNIQSTKELAIGKESSAGQVYRCIVMTADAIQVAVELHSELRSSFGKPYYTQDHIVYGIHWDTLVNDPLELVKIFGGERVDVFAEITTILDKFYANREAIAALVG